MQGRRITRLWGVAALLVCLAVGLQFVFSDSQAGVAVLSPYASGLKVYKGQLHCHTTNSDGRQSPEEVVQAYRDRGYDFVALSDHGVITPPPPVPGIVILPGIEDTTPRGHVNRIGAVSSTNKTSAQISIDKARSEGSFAILNHPVQYETGTKKRMWRFVDILALTGCDAVEIWNALCQNDGRGEMEIDALLTLERRYLLVASDDTHDIKAPNFATTAVMVFADNLSARDILMGLHTGNFYSTCGPRILGVEVKGHVLTVKTKGPCALEFIGHNGEVRASANGVTEASYRIWGDEQYVRVRVKDPQGRLAWTNPVYIFTSH